MRVGEGWGKGFISIKNKKIKKMFQIKVLNFDSFRINIENRKKNISV